MNQPKARLERGTPPSRVALVLVIVLVIWVPLATTLVIGLLFLGIPPLSVGLIVSIPSIVLAWVAPLFFRARKFAHRLLNLALDSKSVNPGEVARGSVELRVDQRFALGSLTARARGGEKAEIVVQAGQTTSRVKEEALVLDQFLVLEPEGLNLMPSGKEGVRVVEPGRYRFRFSVPIPSTAPPSFRGKIARVRYMIRVRASVPRRIDAIREIEIPVTSVSSHHGTPVETSTRRTVRSSSDRPRLRVEGDAREVPMGGTLKGRITVTNLQDRRLQGVRIRLREREWGKAKLQESTSSKTLVLAEIAPSGGLGGHGPFRTAGTDLGEALLRRTDSSVRHFVRIRVRLSWARDLKAEEEIRLVAPLV